jgi:hypothetical protein
MLSHQQQTALKVVGAVFIAQAGLAVAVLKRSFELENKAVRLGQVMHAHLDTLTEEDLEHLRKAGINFNK